MAREIVITDRMIERAVYWLIIILLLALVVFLYLRSPSCSTQATSASATSAVNQAAANTTSNATSNVTAAPPPVAAPPAPETCTDSEKNQDETDVDCGGDVCHQCVEAKKCLKDTDCSTDRCVSGVCASPLSGQTTFSFSDVKYERANSSAPTKLTSITVSITNGEDKPSNVELQVFVQTANGNYYLNQLERDEYDANYKPYATLQVSPIASGKTRQNVYDLEDHYTGVGSYLSSVSGHYDTGEDFLVVVKLVDRDTGVVLGSAQKKVLLG